MPKHYIPWPQGSSYTKVHTIEVRGPSKSLLFVWWEGCEWLIGLSMLQDVEERLQVEGLGICTGRVHVVGCM